MRNLAAVLFVALAACGGGNSDTPPPVDTQEVPDAPLPDTRPPEPDGPTYDFSCMGNSAPANGTAVDPIAITGTTSDLNIGTQMLEPLEGVQVVAIVDGQGQADEDTSDAAGGFTLSLKSGTNPIEGHIEASLAGHVPMRLYPTGPLTTALNNAPLLVISDDTFGLLTTFLGEAQDPTKGSVGLIVTDCANTPIDGATPIVTQNGTPVGSVHDGSALQPGLFLFLNVPAGETTVGATFDNKTLRAHVIDVVATTTSATGVRPGF